MPLQSKPCYVSRRYLAHLINQVFRKISIDAQNYRYNSIFFKSLGEIRRRVVFDRSIRISYFNNLRSNYNTEPEKLVN